MIIEGQVHGGLTEALAVAMGQEVDYDADGNLRNASLLDFFLPTRGRNAGVADRLHDDALAAPSNRRQGCGRVAQCRRRLGLLQCS